MIPNYCKKLGLDSENVMRKASECLRLLEIKATSGVLKQLNLTSAMKTVICIELAANLLNSPLQKENVLRLCGTKKLVYFRSYQIVERMLNLKKSVSIEMVTVKLGCTSIGQMAQNIIQSYANSKLGIDELPNENNALVAAAVLLACKENNIKLQKSQLIELSGTTRKLLENAIPVLESYVPKLKGPEIKGVKRKSKTLMDAIEEKMKDDFAEIPFKKGNLAKKTKIVKISEYDEWKQKILES